ncbi:MAG: HlyC/CorC family transporter [Alphaproteobacteria bacterium]
MTTSIMVMLLVVFVLMLMSAFFSASETALMTSRRTRLHDMAKAGSARAALVRHMVEKPDLLLGTILLGNNAVNIGASAVTTSLFIHLFGEVGVAYATAIMTVLVLIFCEVLPKTAASLMPEKLALVVARPMQMIMWVLRPITEVVRLISRGILQLFGIGGNDPDHTYSERDLRGALGLSLEKGVLEHEEHRMLDSILDMGDLTVEDVMTHRASITSLDAAANLREIIRFISNSSHTRLPVWKGNPDNIVGILHVKDFHNARLLAEETQTEFKLLDILQPAYFIPTTTSVHKQLIEFRRLRRHLALVVDEYGDLQGLVTLEDIIEEIVGDIVDEHDREHPDFVKEADGGYLMAGTIPVRDANREFKWKLPVDGDSVTLAGLIVAKLGHIPTVGESVKFGNLTVTVMEMKRQAITKVKGLKKKVEVKK